MNRQTERHPGSGPASDPLNNSGTAANSASACVSQTPPLNGHTGTPAADRARATDYAPGMRVIIRDEEWMVRRVEVNSLGSKTLYCVGLSPLVKDSESQFLTDIETSIDQVDPTAVSLVPDRSPFFRSGRLFIESQWRRKIPTDNSLHIGHRAAMDPLGFQLVPAQMALNQPRQRLLIADSVGLGKTLEAGVLIAELIARGKGKRILVVTVKSMMTQFQKELWNRFTIPLTRLDSGRIARLRASLPASENPFFHFDKTIVSVDTLKRDVEYRTCLEQAHWDIIVIDEAHNVAERGSGAQRAKLAQLLAKRSDTLILLTATPHDGRAESFASLIRMLDPTAIADPQHYTKDDIAGLCVRRFKKDLDLGTSFQQRTLAIERCRASAVEEEAFACLSRLQLRMDEKNQASGRGQLFKTGLEKALFSSPAACLQTVGHRLATLAKNDPASPDIAALTTLQRHLQSISTASFSRLQRLIALLNDPAYG